MNTVHPFKTGGITGKQGDFPVDRGELFSSAPGIHLLDFNLVFFRYPGNDLDVDSIRQACFDVPFFELLRGGFNLHVG